MQYSYLAVQTIAFPYNNIKDRFDKTKIGAAFFL